MLLQKYSLAIESLVYTETQDVKSSIDTHFAAFMHHVLGYDSMRLNFVSPLELL